MSRHLRLILVGFLFALLFIYAGVNSYFSATNLNSGFPGWYVAQDCKVLVTHFGAIDGANSLENGDVILELNGAPFTNSSQYCETFKEITLASGMGAVYAATDLRLNRQVAVKILMGSMFGDRAALRRFEREARTSARLSHPNIVTVHDYGVLKSEGAFLVMELAPGETLRAKLQREERLRPALAAEVFNQVLEGLKAAHAAGVVHRDLKPGNLLISESDDGGLQARILDFGLAKLTQALAVDSQSPTAAAPLTTPGMAVGTFGYMSPEQLLGRVVDERTDLFAIGVIIVEALTGKRPFSGASYHELLTNILHNPYHLADESPEAYQLDCILQKCLAKDPGARFSSAAKLQEELIAAIHKCPPLSLRLSLDRDAETAILSR